MDWFERLTGFVEATGTDGYEATRQRLAVDGPWLISNVNGRRYRIGRLELASLQSLRERVGGPGTAGPHRMGVLQGNARELHRHPAHAGALFQVASQFNLLEMVGPHVTPEQGVTGYAEDATQGPACAMAAGAATVYRNYFVPVDGQPGQRAHRQLDGFADLGAAIARALGTAPAALWTQRNGYAMFTRDGLARMSAHVQSLDENGRDVLRQRLKIGLHSDVEVTDGTVSPGPLVSQAFCSALPVAYHPFSNDPAWRPLAQLVLEAAYEATLWAAALQARQGGSPQVLLTLLGGGAFGNDERWIRAAMQRAVHTVQGHGLDIALVSFGPPSAELQAWVASLAT